MISQNSYVEIVNEKDRFYGCKGYVEEINGDHYLVRIGGSLIQFHEYELKEVGNG